MKSVHDKFATTEARKNMVNVGSSFKPEKGFTRDDFLSPSKVGEKFSITTAEAEKLMKKLYMRQAAFVLNGHKSPVVLKPKGNGSLLLHPMAQAIFQQQLENQKG